MSVQIITFNCVLKTKSGQVIKSTFNQNVNNAMNGTKTILEGLTRGLQHLKKGERRQISLSHEEAYGLYEPQKVVLFPKSKLPKVINLGQAVVITSKDGQAHSYQVIKLHSDFVSLDGNHPLAGQELIFEIETLEARDATPGEVAKSSNLICSQVLH